MVELDSMVIREVGAGDWVPTDEESRLTVPKDSRLMEAPLNVVCRCSRSTPGRKSHFDRGEEPPGALALMFAPPV